jgi:hypothetical protein
MDSKTQLHNTIFTTERCRIKAEARLKFYETTGQLLTTWYSVLLVVLSIFQNILRQHFHFVDEVSIALAVVVLVFTIAISGLRFGQRADLFKASYHEMQRLRSSISHAKEGDIAAIDQKYVDVLDSSPNHDDQDYKNFIVERWLENRKEDYVRQPSRTEIIGYFRRKFFMWAFVLALWLAPAVCVGWIYFVW